MSTTAQDDELSVQLDDLFADEEQLYADWNDHYPRLIKFIKQHDAEVEREARIAELNGLLDEVQTIEQYDTCDVVHEHTLEHRLTTLLNKRNR